MNLLRNYNEFVLIDQANLSRAVAGLEEGEEDMLQTAIGANIEESISVIQNYIDQN